MPKKDLEITQSIASQLIDSKSKSSDEEPSFVLPDVDMIDLSVDTSPEFRNSLNRSEDRYQLLKLLAVGGYGQIFLARDRVLGRYVVVKSLKETLLNKKKSVVKFIAEAKLVAQLDHPAIIPCYSLDGDDMNGLHLAMQLVKGITLKELLKQCRDRNEPDLQFRRLDAFLRVCDAVEYSHSRGIIHCDLKPDNIMVGRHGEVYVMDWGTACPSGTERKGNVSGTPPYMAPETLIDGITNPQTDVFALGMILNEIVTLRGPVSGDSPKEVMERICRGDFEPSTGIDPRYKVPPALRAIIEKARAINPKERYSSVQQLASDVWHWLFNEEVTAYPNSLLHIIKKYMYGHRNTAILTLAVIFCCFAAMALFGLYREYQIEGKVNYEVLRLAKLQRFTETSATEIDNQLLRVQEQLKIMGTSIGIEMTQADPSSKSDPFYLVSDFKPPHEKPAGLIMAPAYGRKISLDHASYIKPRSMSRSEMEKTSRKLRRLRRPVISLLLNSVINNENVELPADQSMRIFLKKGGLVRRVSICFNNGIGMRFPGMYEKDLTLDAMQNQWIREQRKNAPRRLYWSPPYIDGTGHEVVSCWGPIIDCSGKDIGSIGIEICFYNLVRGLYTQNERERFNATYFILSDDGNQIFSTEDKSLKQTHQGFRKAPHIAAQPFRYSQLLLRFKNDSDKLFIADLNGVATRVSWTKINQTGWILVQLVPRNEVELLDLELDARTRKNVRRKD